MSTRAMAAFIFDLDGVLTDTSEFHFLAWKRLADEEGVPFTRQDNEALRGVSRRESLRLLLKGRPATEAQAAEMTDRKNCYYQAMLDDLSPADLLPGVAHFLDEAQSRAIRIAVASASRNAATVIARLGIEARLDAVADGYSVVNPKPAPDLFVFAAGAVRTPVGRCVVFEDAGAGVEAALRAGMRVVGLGPVERVRRADRVLPDLSQARVDDALSLLES
jgi:beta-phosphoglucomutase